MKKGYKICPNCGKQIKKKAVKCQYCLSFFDDENESKLDEYKCPYCLNVIDINAKVCPFCDETLSVGDDVIDENLVNSSKNSKKVNVRNQHISYSSGDINFGTFLLVLLGVFIFGFVFCRYIVPLIA